MGTRDGIGLVVADDSAPYREGLVRFLRTAPAVEVLAEAEDGAEALEAILREQPDVALLDVRMPVLDGLEVVRRLPADLDVAVVLLSAGSQPELPRPDRCAFLAKTEPRAAILAEVLRLAQDDVAA